RRPEDWREPERVDAEPGQMVELPADPLEVADAVAVGVEKRTRIDLVDDRAAPPGSVPHRGANTTGMCSIPTMKFDGRSGSGSSLASARSGSRSRRVSNMTRSSSRARLAPRQKWTPCPKAT